MSDKIEIADLEFVENRGYKVKGWVPCPRSKDGAINPQVTQMCLGDNQYVSVFHVKPVYYEDIAGNWRPLSEVTVHHGNHKIEFNSDWWKVHPRYLNWLEKRMKLINGQLLIPSLKAVPTPYGGFVKMMHQSLLPPKVGLTTSTFYPDPSVETTTVDGQVNRDAQIETWATCWAAASGTSANDSADFQACCYVADGASPDYKWIYRVAQLYNTASIGDTDTIDSGTTSTYIGAQYDQGGGTASVEYTAVVSSNLASNTAIATTDFDYNDWGTTEYSDQIFYVTNASFNAYVTWTLNASGLAAISKTGVTKFALRNGYDITNTAVVSPSGERYCGHQTMRTADYADVTSDPKLVIVHTAGAVAAPTTRRRHTWW